MEEKCKGAFVIKKRKRCALCINYWGNKLTCIIELKVLDNYNRDKVQIDDDSEVYR